MIPLFWLILILSGLSLLYYCLIIIYSGIGTTFSWLWLSGGAGGILICMVIKYMIRNSIKPEPYMIIILGVGATIGFGLFVVIEATLLYHARHKAEKGMDYLIVLGAQVRGTRISKALRKRLDTAVVYLRDNPGTKAVVSGGRGKDEWITEAEAMEHYLLGVGIKKARIIKEDKSRNTYENILFTKRLLEEGKAVAIVTNGFHIYRSIQIAKKLGFTNIRGLAAPTDKLLAINYYVREAAGVLKDKLSGNI